MKVRDLEDHIITSDSIYLLFSNGNKKKNHPTSVSLCPLVEVQPIHS